MLFDEYSQCADALSNGQVDAVTTDNVILLGFVSESDGEFKLVGEQFTEEPYGIGIEKGDVEFCQFINQTLAGQRGRLRGGLGGHRGPGRGHRDARAARAGRVRLTVRPFRGRPVRPAGRGPHRPTGRRGSGEPRLRQPRLFVDGFLTSLSIILWALVGLARCSAC